MLQVDPHFPMLRILTLDKELDIKRLRLIMSGVCQSTSIDRLGDESYLVKQQPNLRLPNSRIIDLVLFSNQRGIGAKSVIIELEYIDRDINIAHVQLYGRAFRDYLRRATRLHFFLDEITYSDLLDEAKLKKSYIGFCVLSPTQPGVTGRTVLPSPKGDDTWYFVPSQTEFSANLAGIQLSPKGTAFTEQDGRVAACASAALWMSVSILARRFPHEIPVRSAAEITQLATRYSMPPAGSGASPGLTLEQILWALHEIGCEPMAHDCYDADEASELIYRYVESGIPPILLIYLPTPGGYHAVTIVGHTYDPTINPRQELARAESTRVWCPYFLFHDDQIGPYLKLKLAPPDQDGLRPRILVDQSDSFAPSEKAQISQWYCQSSLYYVIAPLPPRHTLRPEAAAIKGKSILKKVYQLYGPRLGIEYPSPPIYRTYFISSNEYKRRFITQKDSNISLELANWYRGSAFPRYIWVTELCCLENRISVEPADLRIVADVSIDPTSSPYLKDFVTLHVPHLFFRMFPSDADANEVLAKPTCFISDDLPYSPLVRLETAQPPIKPTP